MRVNCDRCDSMHAYNEKLQTRIRELEMANEEFIGLYDVAKRLRKDLTSALVREKDYREALKDALHQGNVATVGKWDGTDEMKGICYAALLKYEKDGK